MKPNDDPITDREMSDYLSGQPPHHRKPNSKVRDRESIMAMFDPDLDADFDSDASDV